MILADVSIKKMGDSLISPFEANKVGALCYDLTAKRFFVEDGKDVSCFELHPMCSVFVECRENIQIPNNMAGIVTLRNSRIRQGLSLTAPIYHPCHKTPVFFRVTNMTSKTIELKEGAELASIMFEELSEPTSQPYNGTFQNEDKYKGMGSYSETYGKEMKEINDKVESIKHIERSIYSNVLAIMSIFIAVFSVININVNLSQSDMPLSSLIVFNLCTIGSIAFLVGLVIRIVDSKRSSNYSIFVLSAIMFILAFIVILFS